MSLTDRDRHLFVRVFENRVMTLGQIHSEIFSGISRTAVSRRLSKLREYSYLERRVIQSEHGRDISAYLTTSTALKELRGRYSREITSELCKSDSLDHDVKLVEVRRRLEGLKCVTGYYTENVLQACDEFKSVDVIEPFVRNYTDAVLEFEKNAHKITVGLEFENSDKGIERYTRKLISYYSDANVPIVLYICAEPFIRRALERAELAVVGQNRPRCFYAMSEDVLGVVDSCTFVNLNGDKITLK